MEALWATILFSGFALEVIIRRLKKMSDEKKDQAPRQFDENQGLPPTKLKEGSFMNPRHAIFSEGEENFVGDSEIIALGAVSVK